ncbi:hypothetical protein SEA_ALLEYCAT_46 [Mycobacterium phage AlleyCat]|uniref:Uncharacterized protein n=1 Tax=Mycobacterium phage AlleyCat TaxID=2015840 RepID=A0A221J763_9CAUD|nr:hypothetical protein SEA_ALLEYCAT_46 [Mycobacterium phage AlleyCat]WAB09727.1 hypothetical protein SEA_DADOSKY_46 [Mycobacterium phage Dadosky]
MTASQQPAGVGERRRADDCIDCQLPDKTCPGHWAPNRKQHP